MNEKLGKLVGYQSLDTQKWDKLLKNLDKNRAIDNELKELLHDWFIANLKGKDLQEYKKQINKLSAKEKKETRFSDLLEFFGSLPTHKTFLDKFKDKFGKIDRGKFGKYIFKKLKTFALTKAKNKALVKQFFIKIEGLSK